MITGRAAYNDDMWFIWEYCSLPQYIYYSVVYYQPKTWSERDHWIPFEDWLVEILLPHGEVK